MLKTTIKLIRQFSKLKWQFISLAIFSLYLLILPQILSLFITCLKLIPGSSYSYAECNVLLIIDSFLILACLGLTVLIIINLINQKMRITKAFLLICLVGAGLTITAYYIYLPSALKITNQISIIIDTSDVNN